MSERALQTGNLWFWYQEETPVLRGLDLEISAGEFVAIVGANGSGKTTLIKHFNGLLRPRRGHVLVGDEDADRLSTGELARRVGLLFQHPEQQIFNPTVRQELAFGPRNLDLPPDRVQERVEAALARFDLSAIAEQPPAILSYGQRRRVTLASLAAMDPPVLVLDEPTVGLDALGLHETLAWLTELHAAGHTIVIVTHDMALAAEYAERAIILYEGQILGDGPPVELFEENDLLARASLMPPAVMALAHALRPHLDSRGLTVETFCDDFLARVQDRPEPATANSMPPQVEAAGSSKSREGRT